MSESWEGAELPAAQGNHSVPIIRRTRTQPIAGINFGFPGTPVPYPGAQPMLITVTILREGSSTLLEPSEMVQTPRSPPS